MGTRKKKSSKSKSKWRADERWRKLLGVLFILFAVYLAIAFTSYLYTWKFDQDKVLNFTFQSFIQSDLEVENWLGRLGAYVSNAFFYWGFGLPSIVVIMLSIRFGFDLIRKKSLKPFFILLRNAIVLMAFASLVLEFLFRNSSFTWGGAFGESTCFWLTNFLGSVGLFLLLFFTMIGYFFWRYNPSLEGYSFNLPESNFKIPLSDVFNKFIYAQDHDLENEKVTDDKDNSSPETLRPKIMNKPAEGENAHDLALELSTDESNSAKPADGESSDEGFPKPRILTPKIDVEESPSDELEIVEPLSDEAINVAQASSLNDVIREKTVEDVLNSEPYDPTQDLSDYKFPTLDYLEDYADDNVAIDREELEANKNQIIKTLLDYKIEITKIRATIGPTVTLYEIVPAPGIKISKIKNLEDDIALSLAALGIRIIAPIPGKGTIGIEVPNKNKQIVSLKEVLQSEKFKNTKMALPIALGKTISNEVFIADLAKMPHLLIAGATGQGKSVGINTVIMSLLYKKHPSQVKLVLVDPKKVELFPYSALEQHFLSFLPTEEEPIMTETTKVIHTLNSLCIEMDQRYDLLKAAKSRNIKEYNEKFTARKLNPKNGHKFMPYIVLVIDEFADLIMTAGKEVEMPIARLAQLSRAVGIHLIIATQRPSVNIITGVIKANFPARLAFKVTSKIDSRTILDAGGAEQLIGRGDMLLNIGSSVVRLQCAFVDTPEVEKVIEHISDQRGFPEPFYLPEYTGDDEGGGIGSISWSDLDENFVDAARLVVSNQHGSTSMIQRKMQLGYNRAGRIMDQLEKLGIVGPANGSKPREVLMFTNEELERHIETLRNNTM
jgi:S-DNA-T family DNA segregation ATPase FtsK/SpoIIIE